MTEFRKTVDIKTVNEDERTATGAVLVPNELDHQQDFLRSDAVQNFHAEDPDTGIMHEAFDDSAAQLERNEVISEAEEIGDETFPEGTWVATRRYEDDDLWQLVEDGVLQGFSIGGEISRAADHDDLPDDVRVPDSVEHESGGTELLTGSVKEVSDVDIPAVPRATYKSAELGKSILDDVDGEAEFVDLMVEQRGHDEADARQLYQYLTDTRSKDITRREILQKPIVLPNGAEFDDFGECVDELSEDMTREEAEAICGAGRERSKAEVNGTEIDLTPPVSMVSAAEAAADAGEEGLIPSECGTGTGDDSRDAILSGDLSPDEVRDIASYLVSHEEDVTADGSPSDWSGEEWSDCGNAQYAKWGGTGGGEPMEWAMRRVNEIDRARDEPITYEEVANVNEKNLDDPAFSEGDAVMWSSQDTPVHGRVAGIHEQFSPAGADVTITGDEGEAVYSIHEWDDSLAEPAFQDSPSEPNVAKPESSLDASSMDMPPATEEHFASKTMTTNEPDDATKWRILKRVFFGSDDGGNSSEALDKASDGDEDEEDDEDEDEDEMENNASVGDTAADTMSNDKAQSDEPPEWAKSLTETVEQIDDRVDKLESDEGDDEKAMDDAPEWAQDLAEKVDDLDERVDTISKQSGHSQQLNGTEKTSDDEMDETEAFKAGLVGGR